MTDQLKPVYPEPQHFPEIVDFDEPSPTGYNMPAVALPPPLDDSQPHVTHRYERQSFVCVRCGSRNLARGYVVDYGDKFQAVHFAPKRITLRWLNSLLNLRPWKRLIKLDAEACRDCGAVLLVVDPSDLRRAERVRDEQE